MDVTLADAQRPEILAAAQKILQGPTDKLLGCPIREVLDRISDKWSARIILHLGVAGCLRFNTLRQRTAGISQRMLTLTLRSLEAEGLVTRSVYAQVPPRVEYQLTPAGQSLLDLIVQLGSWAARHPLATAQPGKPAAPAA